MIYLLQCILYKLYPADQCLVIIIELEHKEATAGGLDTKFSRLSGGERG